MVMKKVNIFFLGSFFLISTLQAGRASLQDSKIEKVDPKVAFQQLFERVNKLPKEQVEEPRRSDSKVKKRKYATNQRIYTIEENGERMLLEGI